MKLAKNLSQTKGISLLLLIFLSFIGLWVKIWHKNKLAFHVFQIEACAKQQIYIDNLSGKRVSA